MPRSILLALAATIALMPPLAARAQEAREVTVEIDPSNTHQVIEGFGTCIIDWSRGHRPEYQDPEFLDTIVDDLGISMMRISIPASLEPVNDNDDPNEFNWDAFMTGQVDGGFSFDERIEFLNEFKKRGVKRFLMSPWTPPAFMKTNKAFTHGGHLRADMLEEYAEFMAANIILAKKNHDLDIGAITIQNELLFIEPYNSCIYTPEMAREAVRALMRKFEKEGITTRIFMPEDMMYLDRMLRYIEPTMADPETRNFHGGFCTHRHGGYDVVSAWHEQTKHHGRQNWMTETSGHAQTWPGALNMAEDMYDYLVGGNFSAWVYWQITDREAAGVYALMIDGKKTPKYHAARHFYRFVRPGALRIDGNSSDENVLVSAFRHDVDGTITLVLINKAETSATVTPSVAGENLPETYAVYLSTESIGSEPQADIRAGEAITLPPRSIVTLQGASEALQTKDAIEEWPESWTPPAGSENERWGIAEGPALETPTVRGTFTPLHEAILQGRIDDIDELLNEGADVNAPAMGNWTPIHMAAATFVGGAPHGPEGDHSKYDVFARVLQAEPDLGARTDDGWTALHAAVANSHTAWRQQPEHSLRRIEDLIAAGCDVDATDNAGRTPLHWAAWQGFSEQSGPILADVANILLEHEADTDARDERGRTPLHYAAEMGHTQIVSALLTKADTEIRDRDGKTAIDLAKARGLDDIASMIETGEPAPIAMPQVDPDAGGSGKFGPELLRAAWDGDRERVLELLQQGADVTYRDSDGFSPIDRARDNGHDEIVRILREAAESRTTDGE